jgi:hypothetical protein
MVIFNVFSGPVPAEDSQAWRYMNFVSFVSLLQTRRLFFASPERFDDPFEGVMPPAIAALYTETEPEKQQVGGSTKLWKAAMALRAEREKAGVSTTRYFVNCWHMNDFESAAMWKLYGQDAGIAIQSTKARLMKGFDVEGSNVSIAPVTYFDYNMGDLSSIPLAEYGLPEHYTMMITPELCFKRRSFEHERELRILTWETDPDKKGSGKYVPVSLDVLIEKVYVSPLSPDWVSEVVCREMSHYGLAQEVVHSNLYDRPPTTERSFT